MMAPPAQQDAVTAEPGRQVATKDGASAVRRILGVLTRSYIIIVLDVLLFVILSLIAPHFASARNMFNVLDQDAPLMIVAMGTTFVIIAGGFDLSCGQIVSLGGVFGAFVAVSLDNAVAGVVGTPTVAYLLGVRRRALGLVHLVGLDAGFVFRALEHRLVALAQRRRDVLINDVLKDDIAVSTVLLYLIGCQLQHGFGSLGCECVTADTSASDQTWLQRRRRNGMTSSLSHGLREVCKRVRQYPE